jgi:hypothetical protein
MEFDIDLGPLCRILGKHMSNGWEFYFLKPSTTMAILEQDQTTTQTNNQEYNDSNTPSVANIHKVNNPTPSDEGGSSLESPDLEQQDGSIKAWPGTETK